MKKEKEPFSCAYLTASAFPDLGISLSPFLTSPLASAGTVCNNGVYKPAILSLTPPGCAVRSHLQQYCISRSLSFIGCQSQMGKNIKEEENSSGAEKRSSRSEEKSITTRCINSAFTASLVQPFRELHHLCCTVKIRVVLWA